MSERDNQHEVTVLLSTVGIFVAVLALLASLLVAALTIQEGRAAICAWTGRFCDSRKITIGLLRVNLVNRTERLPENKLHPSPNTQIVHGAEELYNNNIEHNRILFLSALTDDQSYYYSGRSRSGVLASNVMPFYADSSPFIRCLPTDIKSRISGVYAVLSRTFSTDWFGETESVDLTWGIKIIEENDSIEIGNDGFFLYQINTNTYPLPDQDARLFIHLRRKLNNNDVNEATDYEVLLPKATDPAISTCFLPDLLPGNYDLEFELRDDFRHSYPSLKKNLSLR